MLLTQVEAGVCCPVGMTYAAVPALRTQPDVAAEWEPRIQSTTYDPRLRPAAEKGGALLGMAMTEKQGGSDVRRPRGRRRSGRGLPPDGLQGFCSAPMRLPRGVDVGAIIARAPPRVS
jgi:putative acyl-CoA dehydrogenase